METAIKKPLSTGVLQQINYNTAEPKKSMGLLTLDCLNCNKAGVKLETLPGICQRCIMAGGMATAVRVDYHKKHLNYWLRKFQNI